MSDDEPSGRARWLGVVLILLALAALVWQAREAGQGEEPAQPAVLLPAAKPSLGNMLAPFEGARAGLQMAPAVAVAASGTAQTGDEVELCGEGRVKANEAGLPKNMEPVRLAAQRVREQVMAATAGSSDEVTRAAVLLLQSAGLPGAGDAPSDNSALARDALANMAVATRTPQVYAWALRACQGQRGAGSCQMLTTEQLSRLEPGNAFAWLQVAADAQVRKDNAGVAEAMYRASLANQSEARRFGLTNVVAAKLPAEATLLGKTAFIEQVAEVDRGAEIPLVAANQYCSAADVRDANRRQVCAAVAEVFGSRSTTLVELAWGVELGQRVGWPAERTLALRDELDAMAQIAGQPEPGGAWSCSALVKSLARYTQVGQQGELAMLRNVLKRSPETVADLARRHREASAKQAASAASNPASAASLPQ